MRRSVNRSRLSVAPRPPRTVAAGEGTGRTQRGGEAEEQTRRACDEGREREDAPVEGEVEEQAILIGREKQDEKAAQPPGHEQANGRADDREEQAFGEHLTDDPPPRGSDCQADADLALARRRPREHEVRQVGARDEQDEPRDAEQDPQRSRIRLAQVGHAGAGGIDLEEKCEIRTRILGDVARGKCLLEDRRRNGLELCLCPLARPVRLQPAEDRQKPLVTTIQPGPLAAKYGIGADRERDVERTADLDAEKSRRCDANDVEAVAVDQDRALEHAGIAAVFAPPECIAQNYAGRGAPRHVVCGTDQPTPRGANAERVEERSADPESVGWTRLTAAREIKALGRPGHDLAEALLTVADALPENVAEHGPAPHEPARSSLAVGLDGDLDELVRVDDRQRAQAHGVDELEDRGVRACAQRQCQDRDDRKGRVAAEQPRAVAQIPPSGFEKRNRVHVVYLFSDERGVAELAARRVPRVGWRHPACDVVVDFLLEIGLQLAGALIVPVPAPEKTGQAHRSGAHSAGRRI